MYESVFFAFVIKRITEHKKNPEKFISKYPSESLSENRFINKFSPFGYNFPCRAKSKKATKNLKLCLKLSFNRLSNGRFSFHESFIQPKL